MATYGTRKRRSLPRAIAQVVDAEKHRPVVPSHRSPLRAVVAAMLGNLAIAAAKFAAVAVTGSSAMLSEGIHSMVDAGNQGLLLVGDRRSRRPPNKQHPFGHGRELYFWSLVVAIVLFGAGGGLSLYEGMAYLRYGGEVRDPFWNYVVLAVAFVAEGASLTVALHEFSRTKRDGSLWEAFRESKDPRIFVPLAEDVAALAGLLVATAGIFCSQHWGIRAFDGASSVVIGLILGAVALLLAAETRGLLVGERADDHILRQVRAIVAGEPAVLGIHHALTLHMSPDEIMLNLGVYFRSGQSVDDVVAAVQRLEGGIKAVNRRISRVLVEIEGRPRQARAI